MLRGQFISFLMKLLFFFNVTNINALKPKEDTSSILSRLLGTEINKPIVVLVNVGKIPSVSHSDDLVPVSDDDGDLDGGDGGVLNVPDDQETYLLYNMLRSTPEENLAPEVAVSVSKTKEVLRQALRRRCQKLDSCQKKCPPKRPSCPMSCQEVFDNLNVCDPPAQNPCNKCGKTMPPSWLL